MTDSTRPQNQDKPPISGGKGLLLLLVAVVAAVILAVTGIIPRLRARTTLQQQTDALASPSVLVATPQRGQPSEDVVLPGNIQAYTDSPIYARTNGYLKKWYFDIGSRVQKGALLAEIDAPELDQELSQAKAELVTAQANADLSKITSARYSELLKTDGVSKQEVDNAAGDLAAKNAIVQSSQANVRRLEELEAFKRIYAPFSGVITRRNVDIGTLINAGNGGATQLLFSLAQTDPIRTYINVPEAYAASIKPGLAAFLELTQYPGQKFEGKVVRTSEAIELASRTLLTEVDVPNRSGQLLPGGYAQVHLRIKAIGPRLQVPANALLFRSEGLRAVVVDDKNHVHLRPLVIGRDFGVTLEVLDGLKPTEWIVLNPPDALEDGQEVHVKQVANPVKSYTPSNQAKPLPPPADAKKPG